MYDVVTCKRIKVDGPEFVRYDLEMESLFHVSHVTNVHFKKKPCFFLWGWFRNLERKKRKEMNKIIMQKKRWANFIKVGNVVVVRPYWVGFLSKLTTLVAHCQIGIGRVGFSRDSRHKTRRFFIGFCWIEKEIIHSAIIICRAVSVCWLRTKKSCFVLFLFPSWNCVVCAQFVCLCHRREYWFSVYVCLRVWEPCACV